MSNCRFRLSLCRDSVEIVSHFTVTAWNPFFSAPSPAPLGKGWGLMETLPVLIDSLIQMPSVSVPYFLKVHIQVNRLSTYFPLSCFVIEGFRLRAQGQFAYILCSDQSLASVVWPLSKARRILWSSSESLRNVLLGKQRLWGSSQPQSLFSIIIRWSDSRP